MAFLSADFVAVAFGLALASLVADFVDAVGALALAFVAADFVDAKAAATVAPGPVAEAAGKALGSLSSPSEGTEL